MSRSSGCTAATSTRTRPEGPPDNSRREYEVDEPRRRSYRRRWRQNRAAWTSCPRRRQPPDPRRPPCRPSSCRRGRGTARGDLDDATGSPAGESRWASSCPCWSQTTRVRSRWSTTTTGASSAWPAVGVRVNTGPGGSAAGSVRTFRTDCSKPIWSTQATVASPDRWRATAARSALSDGSLTCVTGPSAPSDATRRAQSSMGPGTSPHSPGGCWCQRTMPDGPTPLVTVPTFVGGTNVAPRESTGGVIRGGDSVALSDDTGGASMRVLAGVAACRHALDGVGGRVCCCGRRVPDRPDVGEADVRVQFDR